MASAPSEQRARLDNQEDAQDAQDRIDRVCHTGGDCNKHGPASPKRVCRQSIPFGLVTTKVDDGITVETTWLGPFHASTNLGIGRGC